MTITAVLIVLLAEQSQILPEATVPVHGASALFGLHTELRLLLFTTAATAAAAGGSHCGGKLLPSAGQ